MASVGRAREQAAFRFATVVGADEAGGVLRELGDPSPGLVVGVLRLICDRQAKPSFVAGGVGVAVPQRDGLVDVVVAELGAGEPAADRRRRVPGGTAAGVERQAAASSRGFSSTEMSNNGIYKDIALRHGYAYTASNEGWNRLTIADEPEDSYYESRRRIAELTQHAAGIVRPTTAPRLDAASSGGGSNGGHHTKWLIESFPALYDGGVSMYGYNSGLEMWRAFPIFLRGYDIIRPRIGEIIAAGVQPSTRH